MKKRVRLVAQPVDVDQYEQMTPIVKQVIYGRMYREYVNPPTMQVDQFVTCDENIQVREYRRLLAWWLIQPPSARKRAVMRHNPFDDYILRM